MVRQYISFVRLFFLPTFGSIIFIVFSVLIFFLGNLLLQEGDTAWIIRTGEYIIDTGTIPRHDLYSYTCSEYPWVVYQWGFEVLVASAYKIAGIHGVVWVCSVIIACTLLLMYKLLRALGSPIFVALSLTLLAGIAAADCEWDVRPAIVTQLLFIATLFILHKYKQSKDIRYLYGLPLMFLVWANMHLGFVVGLAAIALTTVERYVLFLTEEDASSKTQERTTVILLIIFLAASSAATLINPNTYQLIPYLVKVISLEQNDFINELQSPDFHKGFEYYLLTLIILIASLTFFPRKAELNILFMTFTFLIASLYNCRFAALFTSLACIVIAQQINTFLASDLKKIKRGKSLIEKFHRISLKLDDLEKTLGSWVPSLIAAIVMTVMVINGYTSKMVDLGFNKERFPVEACNFVKLHKIPGNPYSSGYWGSYILFSLYPSYKVFIDTRFDMYGDKLFFECVACYTGRFKNLEKYIDIHSGDPNTVFNKYQVNWILIEKDAVLATILKKDKGWIKVYSDKIASIFLRDDKANRLWLCENFGISPARQTEQLNTSQ